MLKKTFSQAKVFQGQFMKSGKWASSLALIVFNILCLKSLGDFKCLELLWEKKKLYKYIIIINGCKAQAVPHINAVKYT